MKFKFGLNNKDYTLKIFDLFSLPFHFIFVNAKNFEIPCGFEWGLKISFLGFYFEVVQNDKYWRKYLNVKN